FGPSTIQSRWLAFDASGNLYATTWFPAGVQKISPTGDDLGVFASVGLKAPEDLAFDSHGNLFVADQGTNQIHEFDPMGNPVSVLGSDLYWPVGLAFDEKGNLFVAEHTVRRIHEFGSDGTDLGTFFDVHTIPPYAYDAIGVAFRPVPEPSSFLLMTFGI